MAGDMWLYRPDVCDDHECICNCDECMYADKIFELEEQEEDIVEVVRCKDCKHWNKETELTYCNKKDWMGTDANDYCSFGERREEWQ